MAFLRRTHQTDQYEEEEFASRVSKSGELKNLNPEGRRKRREPMRPWGKKERYFVLLVLLGTAFFASILGLSARDWKVPKLPRLKVPSLSNFFSGETIVIKKGEKVAEVARVSKEEIERAQSTISKFREETNKLSGTYGLAVINLDSGYYFGVNDKEIYTAASLIKLPVLAKLFRESEAGRINLETKYALKDSDKINGSGNLSGKPAGTVLTYRKLAEAMGKQSDNTAFGIIKRILGEERIRKEIQDLGMKNTNLEKNETSPEDIALFFQKLYKREVVSEKSTNEILGYLTDTIYENWLSAGVPKETKVSHKYGREIHVVNDAGIVFAKKPYVVVIMTKGVVEREADEIFPTLSKIVYEGNE